MNSEEFSIINDRLDIIDKRIKLLADRAKIEHDYFRDYLSLLMQSLPGGTDRSIIALQLKNAMTDSLKGLTKLNENMDKMLKNDKEDNDDKNNN